MPQASEATRPASERLKRILIALLLASLLLLSACTATQPITDAVDTGELEDLQSIDQLATAFNEDAGQPRLILLLSPT